MTVYADLLFLINFCMDLLCLILVSKILFKKLSYKRAAASATIGGIYAVARLFIESSFFLGCLLDILCCLVMCAVTFRRRGDSPASLFTTAAIYLFSSSLLGGIMTAAFNLLNRYEIGLEGESSFDIPLWLLLLMGGISFLGAVSWGRIFKRSGSVKKAILEITLGEVSLSVEALCDSGNLLRDCIRGTPVAVVDESYSKKLLGLSPPITPDKLPLLDGSLAKKVALIPYSSASGSKIMVAFRPDGTKTVYKNKSTEVEALIGFAEICRTAEGCSAVIPPELIHE